jgi:hypothetical protein
MLWIYSEFLPNRSCFSSNYIFFVISTKPNTFRTNSSILSWLIVRFCFGRQRCFRNCIDERKTQRCTKLPQPRKRVSDLRVVGHCSRRGGTGTPSIFRNGELKYGCVHYRFVNLCKNTNSNVSKTRKDIFYGLGKLRVFLE